MIKKKKTRSHSTELSLWNIYCGMLTEDFILYKSIIREKVKHILEFNWINSDILIQIRFIIIQT